MASSLVVPSLIRWSDEALGHDRRIATQLFRDQRAASPGRYAAHLAEAKDKVERLFVKTNDLLDIASGRALADDPLLVTPARYLAGPPLSADDLETLAQVPKSRKRLSVADGAAIADVILADLDGERAPWLADGRTPTPTERAQAIAVTAALAASNQAAMVRRTSASRSQESAVRAFLATIPGFREVEPRDIETMQPGEFSRERKIGKDKCDVPVRLLDGSYLLIECKVTNSEVNSVKRLGTCEKDFKAWHEWAETRSLRVQSVAVVAGVFSLVSLQNAQGQGVGLIWEHDLEPLRALVTGAGQGA